MSRMPAGQWRQHPINLPLPQAYYMAAPFAVERAPTVALCCLRKHRSVHVAMLTDYPVRGGSRTRPLFLSASVVVTSAVAA